jgi:glutathione peroxidase-family protein
MEVPESVYDVPVVDAQGQVRTLGEYRGDVLLIVNTASY